MQEETLSSGFPFPMPKVSADQLPTLAEWNSRYIDYVLNFTKGKKTAAARILGINRRTLYRRNKAKGTDMSVSATGDGQRQPHETHEADYGDFNAGIHSGIGSSISSTMSPGMSPSVNAAMAGAGETRHREH